MNWKRSAALCLGLCFAAAVPLTAFAGEGKTGGPIARERSCTTWQDVAVQGRLGGVSPAGEALTYEIVEPPRKGGLVQEAGDSAAFTYTPKAGKTGRDQFSFCVCDAEGNRSAPAKVQVRIEKLRSGIRYADMENHAAHAAALRLAEEGIYTGRKLGSTWFFDPAEPVSRGEFLTLAMAAADIDTGSDVQLTGFGDDESIPTWAKSCASQALNTGLIRGKPQEDRVVFSAEEPISCSEASVILNRVLAVTDVDAGAFAGGEIPAFAVQSVANLTSVQVLNEAPGENVLLNRGAAAEMLSAAMELRARQSDGFSLFHK